MPKALQRQDPDEEEQEVQTHYIKKKNNNLCTLKIANVTGKLWIKNGKETENLQHNLNLIPEFYLWAGESNLAGILKFLAFIFGNIISFYQLAPLSPAVKENKCTAVVPVSLQFC